MPSEKRRRVVVRSQSNGVWLFGAFAILFIWFVVWIIHYGQEQARIQQNKEDLADRKAQQEAQLAQKTDQLKDVWIRYDQTHSADDWWMLEPTQQANIEMAQASSSAARLVSTAIKKYAGVSAQTKQIAQKFGTYRVVYSMGNATVTAFQGDPEEFFRRPGIVMCFYSKQERPQRPSVLFYDKEWNTVMIAGISWPETIVAALLYHELGHAYANSQHWPSAHAAEGSDSWIGEEVAMHTMEADVLNAATKGAYYAKLDAILKRPGIHSPQDAYFSLTPDDLKELDRILGCEKAGPEVAGIIFAEHMATLGFRYIETALPAASRKRAKIELYRSLESFTAKP